MPSCSLPMSTKDQTVWSLLRSVSKPWLFVRTTQTHTSSAATENSVLASPDVKWTLELPENLSLSQGRTAKNHCRRARPNFQCNEHWHLQLLSKQVTQRLTRTSTNEGNSTRTRLEFCRSGIRTTCPWSREKKLGRNATCPTWSLAHTMCFIQTPCVRNGKSTTQVRFRLWDVFE